MERTETRRRGGLAVPLILIAFGLAFLAGNLGLLSWNFWEAAFRLWPLLIVAIGLDVMLGRTSAGAVRTTVGALVIVAMVIGTVAAVTWFSGSNATVESSATVPRADLAAAVVSERISQPLQDAERAKVDLSFGAGSLKVGAQSDPSGLIDGVVAYREGEGVTQDYHVSGDTAYFELHSHNEWVIPWGDRDARIDDRRWDLRLSPEVPLYLKVDGGVGKANLDLAGLKVVDLELRTGVGKVDITLPRHGQMKATVEGGVGKTTILIPRGMAARIQVERGLASVDVMGDYQHRGESYVSPGYDDAVDRVDLFVEGGIGKIAIQEYGF